MAQATGHMTAAELRGLAAESLTVGIPAASRAFGFGSNLGYELAARGEFPCRVLKVGRKLLVPTADIIMALGLAAELDSVRAGSEPS